MTACWMSELSGEIEQIIISFIQTPTRDNSNRMGGILLVDWGIYPSKGDGGKSDMVENVLYVCSGTWKPREFG